MSEEKQVSPPEERRNGKERRGEDRRKQSIPVEVERRQGGDRRHDPERRSPPES
jgi:hypothetical protein